MIKDDRLPLKEKFLDYFRALPVQKLAAGYIGKHEDTITDWKKEDLDFSDQIEIAKSEWARDKAKQVRSKEWLLERVLKDHFAERKETDITSGGKPIPLLSALDVHNNNSTQETKEPEKKD